MRTHPVKDLGRNTRRTRRMRWPGRAPQIGGCGSPPSWCGGAQAGAERSCSRSAYGARWVGAKEVGSSSGTRALAVSHEALRCVLRPTPARLRACYAIQKVIERRVPYRIHVAAGGGEGARSLALGRRGQRARLLLLLLPLLLPSPSFFAFFFCLLCARASAPACRSASRRRSPWCGVRIRTHARARARTMAMQCIFEVGPLRPPLPCVCAVADRAVLRASYSKRKLHDSSTSERRAAHRRCVCPTQRSPGRA